jgi:coenzyme Q-binding protein COQ10
MIRFEATKTLKIPLKLLFEIVSDIDRYPEFVPWCLDAKVSRENEKITANLTVGTSFLKNSYDSDVVLTPYSKIESVCASGPLKSLKNTWDFKESEEGVHVHLLCTFELSSFLFQGMMKKMIDDIGSKMIEAFEKRAHDLS